MTLLSEIFTKGKKIASSGIGEFDRQAQKVGKFFGGVKPPKPEQVPLPDRPTELVQGKPHVEIAPRKSLLESFPMMRKERKSPSQLMKGAIQELATRGDPDRVFVADKVRKVAKQGGDFVTDYMLRQSEIRGKLVQEHGSLKGNALAFWNFEKEFVKGAGRAAFGIATGSGELISKGLAYSMPEGSPAQAYFQEIDDNFDTLQDMVLRPERHGIKNALSISEDAPFAAPAQFAGEFVTPVIGGEAIILKSLGAVRKAYPILSAVGADIVAGAGVSTAQAAYENLSPKEAAINYMFDIAFAPIAASGVKKVFQGNDAVMRAFLDGAESASAISKEAQQTFYDNAKNINWGALADHEIVQVLRDTKMKNPGFQRIPFVGDEKIAKELEPLAAEARKFDTVEEFIEANTEIKQTRRIDNLIEGYARSEAEIKKLSDLQFRFDSKEDPKGFARRGEKIEKIETGNRSAVKQISQETGLGDFTVIEGLGNYIDIGKKTGNTTLTNFYKFIERPKKQLTEIFNKAKEAPTPKDFDRVVKEAKEVPTPKVKPEPPEKIEIKIGKEVEQTFKKEKFNVSAEVEQGIDEAFEGAKLGRRKVKSNPQLEAEARTVSIDDVLIGKKAVGDKEVVALTNFINNTSNKMSELAKKVKKNPALQVQIDELEDQLKRAISLQVKEGTKLGRAVAAYRMQASFTMEPSYWLRRAQRAIGEELPGKVVAKINGFIEDGNRSGLAEYVAQLGQITWLESLTTLRKAGLLLNPKTDIKNVTSNAIFKTIADTADMMFGRPIDSIASLFTKKRTIDFDLSDAFRSWGKFGKGAREGIDLMTKGIDNTNYAGNKIEFRKVFSRFSDNRAERILASYTNTVFGRLEAEDKPFKAMAYAKSLWQQAKIEGKRLNLKGDELSEFIAKRIEDPTETMVKFAQHEALEMTFQAENVLNDLWRGMINSVKKGEIKARTINNKFTRRLAMEMAAVPQFVMEWINPFNKVGTNLFTRAIELTPLGVPKAFADFVLSGQKKGVTTLSRATLGTLITGGLWYWTQGDNAKINLRETSNSKEQSLKYRQGIQSTSITVGDTNISVQGVDPIPSFFLGAGLAQKILDGEMTVAEGAEMFLQSKLDETYFTGIRDMIDLLQGRRDTKRYFARQGASIVPTVLFSLAKSIDPVIRDYDSFFSAMMTRVPILSRSLPARVDAFGKEMSRGDDPVIRTINQFINPFAVSEVKVNKVDEELQKMLDEGVDIDFLPPETRRKLRVGKETIELSSEELQLIRKERGENIWEGLHRLVSSKGWEKMTVERKAVMLKKYYARAWKTTKREIVGQIVEQKAKEEETIEKFFKTNKIKRGTKKLTEEAFDKIVESKEFNELPNPEKVKILEELKTRM